MNIVFGGTKLTPEEIEALRKKRQDYLDYLVVQQTNTNTEVKKKALTPESGATILKVIQTAQDWLAKNPNADLNTVLAQQEKTNIEIKRILTTDKPKNQLNNAITMLPSIAKEAEDKKIIPSDVTPKLNALATETQKWYSKNKDSATSIEIEQQTNQFIQKIKDIVIDGKAIDYIQQKLQAVQNLDPESLQRLRQKNETDLKAIQEQTVNVEKGVNTIASTALQTFFIFLLVGFFILCGSFAANLAISRAPAYRILYFLWGALPIFAPLVLLYTIYVRLRYGRIPMYAILPISIEPATTRLGRFLWYPFYYVPDVESAQLFRDFQTALKTVASP